MYLSTLRGKIASLHSNFKREDFYSTKKIVGLTKHNCEQLNCGCTCKSNQFQCPLKTRSKNSVIKMDVFMLKYVPWKGE